MTNGYFFLINPVCNQNMNSLMLLIATAGIAGVAQNM